MKRGRRILEVVARPGSKDIQCCLMPDIAPFGSAEARAARIVIMYRSPSGVRSALNLARHLAVGDTGVWVICPVNNSPLGYFRFIRFVNFIRHLRDEPAGGSVRVRFFSCLACQDPLESLVTARSVVLAGSDSWRYPTSVAKPSLRTAHHFVIL
jgi:hypothetical protein